jgi:hypothetical protein
MAVPLLRDHNTTPPARGSESRASSGNFKKAMIRFAMDQDVVAVFATFQGA